jgi:hypothetical protein
MGDLPVPRNQGPLVGYSAVPDWMANVLRERMTQLSQKDASMSLGELIVKDSQVKVS